ncbi:MAG: hypothetical protein ACRDRN_03010 [Sciscionella sp.]
MTMPEYDSMDELLTDCAQIPPALRARTPTLQLPRQAAPWSVDDRCADQVTHLDEYV